MLTTKNKLLVETMHLIDGPAGKLEIAVSESAEINRHAFAIVCHPHPLYGGTMQNKVVTTLIKTFQGLGASTVRFNFRGVGLSEGKFDAGVGELDDLLAVMNWMQQVKMRNEIWLGGFSFGAYIAAKAAAQIPVNKLVTIAPPVNHFHMELIPPITCPWVLVQGEQDDVVPAKEVFDWAEQREPKPIIIKIPETGHYFHGLLAELRMKITAALQGDVNNSP